MARPVVYHDEPRASVCTLRENQTLRHSYLHPAHFAMFEPGAENWRLGLDFRSSVDTREVILNASQNALIEIPCQYRGGFFLVTFEEKKVSQPLGWFISDKARNSLQEQLEDKRYDRRSALDYLRSCQKETVIAVLTRFHGIDRHSRTQDHPGLELPQWNSHNVDCKSE
jgi:hypothetical protein